MISLRPLLCRELNPGFLESWESLFGVGLEIHAAGQIWVILSGSEITEACSPDLTMGPEIARPHLRRDGGLEIVDRTK